MKLLGNGDVTPIDAQFEDADTLRDEIEELRQQLALARSETAQTKRESERAMYALRKQLNPLYRALQGVFGELDAAGLEDAPAATPVNPRVSAVWDAWKSRFPGRPAQIIDALLLHGKLNTSQIAVAVGMSRSNVPAVMTRLKKAGIIQKTGDDFSLKQL